MIIRKILTLILPLCLLVTLTTTAFSQSGGQYGVASINGSNTYEVAVKGKAYRTYHRAFADQGFVFWLTPQGFGNQPQNLLAQVNTTLTPQALPKPGQTVYVLEGDVFQKAAVETIGLGNGPFSLLHSFKIQGGAEDGKLVMTSIFATESEASQLNWPIGAAGTGGGGQPAGGGGQPAGGGNPPVGGQPPAGNCPNLPAQVAQLRGEFAQGNVKTDCIVDQLMAWSVRNASKPGDFGATVSDAMRYMKAIGYETLMPNGYPQGHIDSWRNGPGGIPKAFAAWAGSNAATMYLQDKSEYVFFQYRKLAAAPASSFTIKIEYDSPFTEAEKSIIQTAAGYWQQKLADPFTLTLHFKRDPSISAYAQAMTGEVAGSCFDHQPPVGFITVKDQVNDSLISHEIGHVLGIGDASVFKPNSPCGKLAQAADAIQGFPRPGSARIGADGVFHGTETDRLTGSRGIKFVKGSGIDQETGWGHVDSSEKDSSGNASAVQNGMGGKPSLLDFAILKDLGYTVK